MEALLIPGMHYFSLTKNFKQRPKYKKLLEHPFMRKYETANVNVAEWYANAKQQFEINSCNSPIRRCTPPSPSPSARRHTPLHHTHHRSLSETVPQPNTNGGDAGRFSAFQRLDPNSRLENNAQASTPPLQQQDFWRPVQSSATDAEWDANRVVG
ncbi:hypothetical protein C0J52_07054 [Blattella germanica]|nr:hypothetical protein C0J52_07054 [Blattella germanica]